MTTQKEITMEILTFDYNLDHGVVWITVPNKHVDGKTLTIQCCTHKSSTDELLVIDAIDCGFDWGLCAGANEEAIDLYGENRCFTALMNKAKSEGFEVRNF